MIWLGGLLLVGALGLGIWLGLPGRHLQSPEEIAQRLAEPGKVRQRVKRTSTLIDLITGRASGSNRRRSR